jgi:hypothetical protein
MGGVHLMIKQNFNVEHYWKVTVFYDWNCDFLCDVVDVLKVGGFSKNFVRKVLYNMYVEDARAVTCSNISNKVSIVIFNQHKSKADYLNSIVHEAEHIKQALFKAYKAEDAGEPPAYAVGYIVMRMYEAFKRFL